MNHRLVIMMLVIVVKLVVENGRIPVEIIDVQIIIHFNKYHQILFHQDLMIENFVIILNLDNQNEQMKLI